MDFKEVCCNIRSCLNSSKSQLSLQQLNRDYNEVLGESIPYRKVGYQSLEALIRAVPNLRISSIRGELFIDVKPDEKTAHIASLVREQKVAKKKKKKSSYNRGGGYYRGPAPPPRRPATMPPPRRSGPPPSRPSCDRDRQQSDFRSNVRTETYGSDRRRDSQPEYNNSARRRDSPPEQSYQNNQRRQSPPRRKDTYYSRRTDQYPPAQSYSNHRNSSPISISSDDENTTERITRNYRPYPTQWDFSDSNEVDGCGSGSDLEDCDEINSRMEELTMTISLQQQKREVSIDKPKYRSYPSNTSNEDDFGYQSMKTTTVNERKARSGGSRAYYQTQSSDSYDDYEDDYDYGSSSTTTTTTTDKDRFDSTDTSGHRRPFNPTQGISKGRGYRPENLRGTSEMPTSVKCKGAMPPQGNIKVTVPNGSGRARVVDFLLR